MKTLENLVGLNPIINTCVLTYLNLDKYYRKYYWHVFGDDELDLFWMLGWIYFIIWLRFGYWDVVIVGCCIWMFCHQ